jgi:hypothetical protein
MGPRIEFVLSCQKPEDLPKNLTTFPEYVFAAKVHSIRKDPRFAAEILKTGFSIEGPLFTVRGHCVELKINEKRLKLDEQESKELKAIQRLKSLAK